MQKETLHLILKKKWFDMIKAGIKKEEYREIKPYWIVRFININYPEEEKGQNKNVPDNIMFDIERGHDWQYVLKDYYSEMKHFNTVFSKNGYSKGAPVISWGHKGIRIGKPNPEWCEPETVGKDVFILDIGTVELT